MTRNIGFEGGKNEWEGPLKLQFHKDEKHTAIRYVAELNKQKFTFYPPTPLLGAKLQRTLPTVILVTIGKAQHATGDLKFPSEIRSEDDSIEHLVYEFAEEKVNSIRYNTSDVKDNASLYIPKEVFRGMKHPKRVFLAITLPKEAQE